MNESKIRQQELGIAPDGEEREHTAELEAVQIVEVCDQPPWPTPPPLHAIGEALRGTRVQTRDSTETAVSDDNVAFIVGVQPVPWHKLDYREAMLLAAVDGKRSRDKIISSCGLDRATGDQLFDRLLQRGLITAGH